MTMDVSRKVVKGENDAVARRQVVVDLVANEAVGSQADLAELLGGRGFNVTQATLSRDLKALGIGKIPKGRGYAYVLPNATWEAVQGRSKPVSLDSFVKDTKLVNNLVLLKTAEGNAHVVSRTIDEMSWDEVQGTIGGSDTVMVITDSPERAQEFVGRLQSEVHLQSA